jgi:hypothetical protein
MLLFHEWLKPAATAGVCGAQYDLSVSYLKGEGCERWYRGGPYGEIRATPIVHFHKL